MDASAEGVVSLSGWGKLRKLSGLNLSKCRVLDARKRHSLACSALPVRKKILPLGQSLNTSHRLQSGLRA
jgi:hypothetical protein